MGAIKVVKNNDIARYDLCCIIVDYGLGSKVLKEAKSYGVTGGTILLGKGTIRSYLLKLLDLDEVKKEIVLIVAERSIAEKALEHLNQKFKMYKLNHGIAFSTPVIGLVGTKSCDFHKNIANGGVGSNMYNGIFTIVDIGNAEKVVEAAESAGSNGGTVINARGSGIHERSKLFAMLVEPEKEIILNITKKDKTDDVVKAINDALEIEKPGNGIIFILDLNKTYGLYDED